jgi:hypothetical protein
MREEATAMLRDSLRGTRGDAAYDETGQEKHMSDLNQTTIEMTPRRGFLRRAGSAAALGLAGLMPSALHAQPAPKRADGPNWPGLLKGRHRQVVDAYEVNSGFPLAFAYTFLAPNESATAVIILRHGAFPIALGDALWAKYKIGETFMIIDPETKAPAVKNPFFHPKPGVLIVDDMALDRLLAKGAVVGGCNVALQIHSVGHMGRKPRPGGWLHVLCRRLIRGAPSSAYLTGNGGPAAAAGRPTYRPQRRSLSASRRPSCWNLIAF